MVRAIPVTYNDITFRSMTEAKMAIFFDLMNFEWEYEPMKFSLGEYDGKQLNYVPDFVIHNVYGRLCGGDLYIECKGSELSDKEWQKIVLFGQFKKKSPQRPFLLVNDIFWFERFYKAPGYIANIKARRPQNAYGLWFHALFTVCNESSSDIAVICKTKSDKAAVYSESEFYSYADVDSTLAAFQMTREANFGGAHKFIGFTQSNLPLDIQFNPDDIPAY